MISSKPRILSLLASATEIACALGFEDHLVGRSHECDFPETVKRLPVCTEPKFPVSGTSIEIDRSVKAILTNALSVYRVDAERLQQLQPDVVLTQSHCEVCAVSMRDVEEALCGWTGGRPCVVSLAPEALADVWSGIIQVAHALNVKARGEALVKKLKKRMVAIAGKANGFLEKPSVACIEWIEPLMAAGNWVPDLVKMAGGKNLLGEAGKHSPWMSWEELTAKDPDVILIMPCGFDISRSRKEMPALTEKPEWPELKAVRNRHVYITDGNQYFNRPGPRLVESLEILAEIFHPETFRFGHEETGWQQLNI